MNCVLYDTSISDGAKVTYMMLLDFARQEESCFPGQLKLAERRSTTERTIRNHLVELQGRGLISIEQRGHMKTNVYWIEEVRSVYVPPQESDRKNFSAKEDAVVKRHRYKKTEALNVSEDEALNPAPSTPNEEGRGIYAIRDKAVSELVALTGDEGSLRRFQQLWEVAEGKGALEAWQAALRATQRRLGGNAKQGLDRPGAYFDKICVGELEKREVFVPTIAQKQADLGVGDAVRQGLFGDETLLVAEEEPAPQEPISVVAVAPPITAAELVAELAALESQGGAPYEAFQSFCEAERERYSAEMGKVSPTSRERLLAVFDRPDKQRDLFQKWKVSGQEIG
ncbi:helix-turn-helix domain-containing protein [Armatimonas sp.]|uniref:helix-turn-helix domain-containing protein n=1 Tax=Armatimonas sp. TaxID=1872638 RepID=UPI003752EA3D